MDLGISGRRAIVCASSDGLGRGCAVSLAQAGVSVVVNGRDPGKVAATVSDIERLTGVTSTGVCADIGTPDGQAAVLAACPEPDILVTNNGGPPFQDFRTLDRAALLAGVTANMVTPIELIRSVIDGMSHRGFGRIVNITSLSVRMPMEGLDLSSGARAGLTAFLAGIARGVVHRNVTINNLLPGSFDTQRLRQGITRQALRTGRSEEAVAELDRAAIPAGRFGTVEEFGAACAFLCSVHAGYITGQNLTLDGGAFPGAF